MEFAQRPDRRNMLRKQCATARRRFASGVQQRPAEFVVSLEIGRLCDDRILKDPHIDAVYQRDFVRLVEQTDLLDRGKRFIGPIDSCDNFHGCSLSCGSGLPEAG